MAFNSYYNMLWKRQHRFGIGLSLLVYSISYLICDFFYMDHSSISSILNIDNLYLISFILITISTFVLIIFDSILNNNTLCIRIITSILLIIGGLLYFVLIFIQCLQRHEIKEDNELLFNLLYLSSSIFITGNALILGVINLMECYFCKTILLINTVLFLITSCGMIYFWSIYYNDSAISPTQIQIGLIQTGWIIIATVCSSMSFVVCCSILFCLFLCS